MILESWANVPLWLWTGARAPGSTCTLLLSLLYIYLPELWFCLESFFNMFLPNLSSVPGGSKISFDNRCLQKCSCSLWWKQAWPPGLFSASQFVFIFICSLFDFCFFRRTVPLVLLPLLSFVHLGTHFLPILFFFSPAAVLSAPLTFPAPLPGDDTLHHLY